MEVLEKTGEDFERIVSLRIKERRLARGLSQAHLAEALGISPQQFQKYETGKNHLTIIRISQIAEVLGVPAAYFFENIHSDLLPSEDAIPKPLTRPLRILLVEDSPSDTLLFARATEGISENVDIHCISDTETVNDFLRHHTDKYARPSPDIVVLDLSMPKINGLQLLKQIKSNRESAALPVIILTNSISKKEMQQAYAIGASGFIQKSLRMDSFKDSIRAMVEYWSKIVILPSK